MSENQNSINGRWTNQEHQQFLIGVQLFGKDWRKIQDVVKTRNGSQIRSHAQKYFLKYKKGTKKTKSIPQQLQNSQIYELPFEKSTLNSFSTQVTSDCSYFLGKIFQFTHNYPCKQIWNALIDIGSLQQNVSQMQQHKPNTQKNNDIPDKIITQFSHDQQSDSINDQTQVK